MHFGRRSFPGQHSIERVAADVRAHLPDRFEVTVVNSDTYSKGLWPRIATVLQARRLEADVLHIVGDITYAGLLTRRSTTVLTVYDTEFLERAGWLKGQIFTWLWLRLPIRRAAVVTVPSEATRRDLLSLGGIPADRLTVIPPPVGAEFVPAQRKPGPEPTVPTVPTVLMVGTRSNKNVRRAAEALAGIPCRAVVLGDLDPEQRAAFGRSGVEVTALGEVDPARVVQAYVDCDVVMYPSTKEGFGLPIVEAQATGRPVVTSDLPPMNDVAGGAACLVDPLDVGSIHDGVASVLGDAAYREDLVRRGFENARRFGVERVALEYAEVYDRLRRRPAAGTTRSGPAPSAPS